MTLAPLAHDTLNILLGFIGGLLFCWACIYFGTDYLLNIFGNKTMNKVIRFLREDKKVNGK